MCEIAEAIGFVMIRRTQYGEYIIQPKNLKGFVCGFRNMCERNEKGSYKVCNGHRQKD